MLTLYDYFRSSACFRVRIALHLKNIAYQKSNVHLLNHGGEQLLPTYTAINHQQLIPSLDDHGNIITQSLAIIEYLEECHPTPALLPKRPLERARVRAFAMSIAADIHPLNNLRVLNFLKNEFHVTDDAKMQWYHHWIAKGFGALEAQLINTPHQYDFCFGDTPSLADICLIPQWYNAKRFNCDLSNYPTLNRIYNTCEQIPAFIAAFPEEAVA
jgi:maleylacetoacetate isomerase